MKWSFGTVAALVLAATAGTEAFTSPRAFARASRSSLSMGYSVGIVGATGAVGKEIRSCLENRDFPVDQLRIFGSERSAGSTVDTKYGDVKVELFDVKSARECDVVFLAVDGAFSLLHGVALTEGDDGCVCIDNSVRTEPTAFWYCYIHSLSYALFVFVVGLSQRSQHSPCCAGDQWQGNTQKQAHCQP
jgi:hypothetical protein